MSKRVFQSSASLSLTFPFSSISLIYYVPFLPRVQDPAQVEAMQESVVRRRMEQHTRTQTNSENGPIYQVFSEAHAWPCGSTRAHSRGIPPCCGTPTQPRHLWAVQPLAHACPHCWSGAAAWLSAPTLCSAPPGWS